MRVGSRFDDFWWLHDEVLTDTRGGGMSLQFSLLRILIVSLLIFNVFSLLGRWNSPGQEITVWPVL